MLLNFAIFSPNTSSDPLATCRNPSVYPADRLTNMQSILAALADLETAYEIEREQIEQWSEPVRAKLEEDEEVMLLWSALVFRRRADVEGRDPLYLRPQGLAVPHGCDRCRMGAGPPLRGCRAKQVGAAPG